MHTNQTPHAPTSDTAIRPGAYERHLVVHITVRSLPPEHRPGSTASKHADRLYIDAVDVTECEIHPNASGARLPANAYDFIEDALNGAHIGQFDDE